MRKPLSLLIILKRITLAFKSEGQDFTYGFVVGDTAQLIYEDTLSFNIQWQERNHATSSWKNIQNATSAILEIVYRNTIDSQKLYRAKITYDGAPCIYYSKQIVSAP